MTLTLSSTLLLTEPMFNFDKVRSQTYEKVYEEYGFAALCVRSAPTLAARAASIAGPRSRPVPLTPTSPVRPHQTVPVGSGSNQRVATLIPPSAQRPVHTQWRDPAPRVAQSLGK